MQVMVKLPVACEQPANLHLTLVRSRSCRMKTQHRNVLSGETEQQHQTSHRPESVYSNPEHHVML